jgi:hypothetical protein
MMDARALMAVARYGGTAVMAGLTAAYGYYPSVHWLPIAIAVVGTLGFHVVSTAPQFAVPPRMVTIMQPEDINLTRRGKTDGSGS